jgi:CHASE2 domain-containing sensor protein
MVGAESITKVVRLEFTGGDFEQGFRVNLSLGEEGKSAILKETGCLPPLPKLPQQYQLWRDSYRGSGLLTRIKAVPIEGNISLDACQKQAKVLCDQFNLWLLADSFREIQHKLRTYLSPTDTVRLILDVDDDRIQKLPWQLWKFLEDFPNAEIAIAAPNTRIPTGLASNLAVEVRILAVLGDSQGINVEEDRAFLEKNFPGAEFLVEPDHKTLQNMLCDHPWDILYFAGHSYSENGNQTGRICINRQESLTIEEISHPLKTAIAKGLQIAIFNSCDGLGLARSLGHLQIPQTIFMREPVPDKVAQEFLKYFLMAFATGESFYQAVRSARLQLQYLEKDYPCATWLPVIYQNAVMIPPRWKDLQLAPTIPGDDLSVVGSKKLGLVGALVCSGAVAIALGWVRHQGWLQAWELQAYDHVMQVRSLVQVDPVDSKMLVITIGDEDKAAYGDVKDDLSITSNNLLSLLKKLQQAKAKLVGLDLIRDSQGLSPQFVQQIQRIPNVVAACGNAAVDTPGFKPPQGLERSIGFVDMAQDPGGTIRRQLLSLPLDDQSPCQSELSFGLALAANYLNLAPEAIEKRLSVMDGASHPGVYQRQPERESLSPQDFGHVMINYRNSKMPQISMGDFMKGRAGPLNLADKIVLVGIVRSNSKDRHSTPLAKNVSGVLIQAEQTSHLVNLVLKTRSPIWVWPEWGDWLWIGAWSVMGGLIVWRGRSQVVVIISMVSGVIVIYVMGCLVLIAMTGWIPLIPPVLSLLLTIVCLSIFEQIQPKIASSKL